MQLQAAINYGTATGSAEGGCKLQSITAQPQAVSDTPIILHDVSRGGFYFTFH